jgi:hypothetical protein
MMNMKLFISVILVSLSLKAEMLNYELDFTENNINQEVDGEPFTLPPPPPPMTEPGDDYQPTRNFSHIDPTRIVSPNHLKKALAFFDLNYDKITNKKFINVIDVSMTASQRRMFLIDMQTGAVKPMLTAVGVGSDPDGDGVATMFSNVSGSRMTSLGFYLTAGEYQGGNGRSMRLHGLSVTNNNALSRLIVVHGATYVLEDSNYAGRSHGCPAVDFKHLNEVIDKTKDGTLMYIGFRE